MIHFLTKDHCLEGIQNVPENWEPCCLSLELATKACQYEVRVEYHGQGWGMPILDGGSSWKQILYCPFCGNKL